MYMRLCRSCQEHQPFMGHCCLRCHIGCYHEPYSTIGYAQLYVCSHSYMASVGKHPHLASDHSSQLDASVPCEIVRGEHLLKKLL
jgi:hypothetical protein